MTTGDYGTRAAVSNGNILGYPEAGLEAQLLERVDAVVDALHEPLDPAQAPDLLLHTVLERLQLPAGALYQAGDSANEPTLLAARGLPDPLPAQLPSVSAPPASGPASDNLRELQAAAKPVREQLQHAGFGGIVRLPLTHAGREVGLLELFLMRPLTLSPTVRSALERVARHLTLALLQARRAARPPQADTATSVIDPLTGLYSSHHFHTLLDAEVERNRRHGGQLSLLLLDIDDFKSFNRLYGRAEGDRLLARIGRLLRGSLRKMDAASRYGGEEFLVLLPGCEPNVLYALADRVRREFAEQPFRLADGRDVAVSVSIGAACHSPQESVTALIRDLDDALQQAKRTGKNRVDLAVPSPR